MVGAIRCFAQIQKAGGQRLVAGRRQPAEPGGEHHDDDDRPEELRHRDAEIGRNRDGVVERAAVAQRRDHAEADADDRDQHERDRGQHQRAAERLHQHRSDRPVHQHATCRDRRAEKRQAQRQYCSQTGSFRPSLSSSALHLLGRRERPEDQIGDIGRQERRDGEHQHRHRQEHQRDEDDPPGDVSGHVRA